MNTNELENELFITKKNEYDLLMSMFAKKIEFRTAYSMTSVLNSFKRELKRGLVTDIIEYKLECENGTVILKIDPSNSKYPICITTYNEKSFNQLFFDFEFNIKNINESNMQYYDWIQYALPHLYLPARTLPRWVAKDIKIEGDRKNTDIPSLGIVCMPFRELDRLKKLRILIDMINKGYVPKTNEYEACFEGTDVLIKQFWFEYRDKINYILNNDIIYKEGYDRAKYVVSVLCTNISLKLHDYIELINSGSYIPKNIDNVTNFPGTEEKIGAFWRENRERIKFILETREEYKTGYERAYRFIQNSFITDEEKTSAYIELLNSGTYIPKSADSNTLFPGFDKTIGTFYATNVREIYNELFNNPKYLVGYDVAKYILKLYISLTESGLAGPQLLSTFKSSIIVFSSSNDIAKKIAIDNGWIEIDNDNVRKKR